MERPCRCRQVSWFAPPIRQLMGRPLITPLFPVIEPSNPGYVAYLAEIPLFAYGDSEAEAVHALREGIESVMQGGEEFLDQRAAIQRLMKIAV